jgi:hypothetical protein
LQVLRAGLSKLFDGIQLHGNAGISISIRRNSHRIITGVIRSKEVSGIRWQMIISLSGKIYPCGFSSDVMRPNFLDRLKVRMTISRGQYGALRI